MRSNLAAAGALAVAVSCGPGIEYLDETRQATGVKVGEVTSESAIIWTRVTAAAERNASGLVIKGRPEKPEPGEPTPVLDPAQLHGSAPGAPGMVRLRYDSNVNFFDPVLTDWIAVAAENDYTHHFRLEGLEPATVYYFEVTTSSLDGAVQHQALNGRFETAPREDEYDRVTFTAVTGQANRDHDDPDGFKIYRSMLELAPKFIVPTGDTIYYDSDAPLATSIELARYHWHRMYSFPTIRRFHLSVPGYWEKDDHDSYHNDNWPGASWPYMGSFSWDRGLQVYAEQVPMSELPYRTFRWGQGLQVWVVEGRDFRSPNPMDDGPAKSIWGAEQKRWLKETLLASDADWKVLVSPTPVVGPDRTNKGDNHSNAAFRHEGDEMRAWFAEHLPENFFIVCGDRHWQYHSVHPDTGVQEFSSGPATDEHAGGSPGLDETYHRFHRVAGGFASVTTEKVLDESSIAFRLHNVDGGVEYEWKRSVLR